MNPLCHIFTPKKINEGNTGTFYYPTSIFQLFSTFFHFFRFFRFFNFFQLFSTFFLLFQLFSTFFNFFDFSTFSIFQFFSTFFNFSIFFIFFNLPIQDHTTISSSSLLYIMFGFVVCYFSAPYVSIHLGMGYTFFDHSSRGDLYAL